MKNVELNGWLHSYTRQVSSTWAEGMHVAENLYKLSVEAVAPAADLNDTAMSVCYLFS